jgi:hypothetical protein
VDDTTGFAIGDIVTIHADRTNANGVTNGVDYTDGKMQVRRIVAISGTTGGTLSFDRPILEPLTTDLGGGVYGYVTKGRHVHSMLFIAGNDGVVQGVAQPPMIHTPAPVDDLGMIYRFTYDMYSGWQAFNKHAFEVAFVAGSNRVTGPRIL